MLDLLTFLEDVRRVKRNWLLIEIFSKLMMSSIVRDSGRAGHPGSSARPSVFLAQLCGRIDDVRALLE